jgi:hypothetical protein
MIFLVPEGVRECRPAVLLHGLFDGGGLPRFCAAVRPELTSGGLGNCHQASAALLTDLCVAGEDKGWFLVTAWIRPQGRKAALGIPGSNATGGRSTAGAVAWRSFMGSPPTTRYSGHAASSAATVTRSSNGLTVNRQNLVTLRDRPPRSRRLPR